MSEELPEIPTGIEIVWVCLRLFWLPFVVIALI